MEDYKHLKDEDLVDLLAAVTAKYTKFVNQARSSQEFIDSKEVLRSLLSEMDRRKVVHTPQLNCNNKEVDLK